MTQSAATHDLVRTLFITASENNMAEAFKKQIKLERLSDARLGAH
jgi:hypothetical protein